MDGDGDRRAAAGDRGGLFGTLSTRRLRLRVSGQFYRVVIKDEWKTRRTSMDQPSARANMAQAADPLPSWNDGPARRAIIEFVTTVTKPDSPEFVPIAERIALFDNDGTLWAEQPTFSRHCSPSTASDNWPPNIQNGRPGSRSLRS